MEHRTKCEYCGLVGNKKLNITDGLGRVCGECMEQYVYQKIKKAFKGEHMENERYKVNFRGEEFIVRFKHDRFTGDERPTLTHGRRVVGRTQAFILPKDKTISTPIATTEAECAEGDCFSYKRGRAISMGRLVSKLQKM